VASPWRQVLQFGSFYDYAAHEIAPSLDVEPMGELLEAGAYTRSHVSPT
jgi:hypothetical protein